jgi:hypothetical protein
MTAPTAQELVPARPAQDQPVPALPTVPVLPVSPGILADLDRNISGALTALGAMPDCDDEDADSDVTIRPFTGAVCAGGSVDQALTEAARWARAAADQDFQLHAVNYARVPGSVNGEWEHRITLMVSFPEGGTGEYTGDTHTEDDDDSAEDHSLLDGPQVLRGTAGHRVEHDGAARWT